jgi:hypothetical protein
MKKEKTDGFWIVACRLQLTCLPVTLHRKSFSQKVLKFFRRASVAEDITNTDYAGEIENFGDTVRIIKEPTITVSSILTWLLWLTAQRLG